MKKKELSPKQVAALARGRKIRAEKLKKAKKVKKTK